MIVVMCLLVTNLTLTGIVKRAASLDVLQSHKQIFPVT
jgi:hypothetical protein